MTPRADPSTPERKNDSLTPRFSLIERAAERVDLIAGRTSGLRHSPPPPQPEVPSSVPHPEVARASTPRQRLNIDLAPLRAKGIIARERSATSEEFRRIKRTVLARARFGGGRGLGNNLIIVTSALPGEGKSFISINLAMSIALERDYRVLFVEGDVVRRRLGKEMGFEASCGLIDLLLDDSVNVADVLLRTNIDNLTVVPAGKPHDLNTELVASKRMENVLREIASRYRDRIIIFDSPPVLVGNEAIALAQYMGQILLVVAAEETTRASIEAAVEQLPSGASLGIIMNRMRRTLRNLQ